jgi:hypothetical protein
LEQELEKLNLGLRKEWRTDHLLVRRIDITDSDGTIRATLNVEDKDPWILLHNGVVDIRRDEDGRKLVVGGTVNGFPGLTQYEADGRKIHEAFPVLDNPN